MVFSDASWWREDRCAEDTLDSQLAPSLAFPSQCSQPETTSGENNEKEKANPHGNRIRTDLPIEHGELGMTKMAPHAKEKNKGEDEGEGHSDIFRLHTYSGSFFS